MGYLEVRYNKVVAFAQEKTQFQSLRTESHCQSAAAEEIEASFPINYREYLPSPSYFQYNFFEIITIVFENTKYLETIYDYNMKWLNTMRKITKLMQTKPLGMILQSLQN